MNRWNPVKNSITAILASAAMFNACKTPENPVIHPYQDVALVEAFTHMAGASGVTADIPNKIGLVGYSRGNGDGLNSVSSYLTDKKDVVYERGSGEQEGNVFRMMLPQDVLMTADGLGFYDLSRDGTTIGSLKNVRVVREDDRTRFSGELCPVRSTCREVIGSKYADGSFSVYFMPPPGESPRAITGEMRYHK